MEATAIPDISFFSGPVYLTEELIRDLKKFGYEDDIEERGEQWFLTKGALAKISETLKLLKSKTPKDVIRQVEDFTRGKLSTVSLPPGNRWYVGAQYNEDLALGNYSITVEVGAYSKGDRSSAPLHEINSPVLSLQNHRLNEKHLIGSNSAAYWMLGHESPFMNMDLLELWQRADALQVLQGYAEILEGSVFVEQLMSYALQMPEEIERNANMENKYPALTSVLVAAEAEENFDPYKIASEWHGGQFTELYKFSSSGKVDSKNALIWEIADARRIVKKNPEKFDPGDDEKLAFLYDYVQSELPADPAEEPIDASAEEMEAARKKKSPEDLLEDEIEKTYYKYGHGVQISIMDIPKLFDFVKKEVGAGKDMDSAVKEAIEKFKVQAGAEETEAREESKKSLKAPKKWWDEKEAEVKKGNPDYSEEKIRETVGDIWFHKMSEEQRKEARESEGKEYGPAKSAVEPGHPTVVSYYEVITPESAEIGDAEERGEHDEFDCTPDAEDAAEGVTAVDLAYQYLMDNKGYFEPSSSVYHQGIWYSTTDPEKDYATGAETYYSYHLKNFTPEQEKAVYDKLFHKEQKPVAAVAGTPVVAAESPYQKWLRDPQGKTLNESKWEWELSKKDLTPERRAEAEKFLKKAQNEAKKAKESKKPEGAAEGTEAAPTKQPIDYFKAKVKADTLSVFMGDTVQCFLSIQHPGGQEETANVTLRFDHGDNAFIAGYPSDWGVHDVNIEYYNSESPTYEEAIENYGLLSEDDTQELGMPVYISKETEAEILRQLKGALEKQFKDPEWDKYADQAKRQDALKKIDNSIAKLESGQSLTD